MAEADSQMIKEVLKEVVDLITQDHTRSKAMTQALISRTHRDESDVQSTRGYEVLKCSSLRRVPAAWSLSLCGPVTNKRIPKKLSSALEQAC